MTTVTAPRVGGAHIITAIAGWLLLATLTVRGGALSPLSAPLLVPPSTAVLLGALWFVPALRVWARVVGLRPLVALHLSRLVGLTFLALAARGALPRAFAVPAAVGDVAAALGAGGVLVYCLPPVRAARRRALLGWNALGLADMLFVVATAARLTRADPGSMAPLARLPLALLPTVLVPLILVSHLLLFARLRCRAEG